MADLKMIPAGYMAKRVVRREYWLKAPQVVDIYSVSSCCSEDFDPEYIRHWKHNGWWLFDSPQIIQEILAEEAIPADGLTYFYYEFYGQEYLREVKAWRSISPGRKVAVNNPEFKSLEGYDASTFSCGNTSECSPLSCNHLASEIVTNKHCLFESFDDAKRSLENGEFEHSERGPLRIIAVYSLEDTRVRRERLRYRSHHRGTKEMDVLLGRFAERYLDGFGVIELTEYEALLEEQDQDLYDWALGRSEPPTEKLTGVCKLYITG